MRNVSLNLGSVRLAAAAMRGRCAGRRPALRPRAGPRCWRSPRTPAQEGEKG